MRAPQGDGRDRAFLKLVAGLLGVSYDALAQREAQRRHRRLLAVTTASLCGMAAGDRARRHRVRRAQRCTATTGAGRGHPRFHARRPAREADDRRAPGPDARRRRQGHRLFRHAQAARPERPRAGGAGALADRHRPGAAGRGQVRPGDDCVPRSLRSQPRAGRSRSAQRPAPVRSCAVGILDRPGVLAPGPVRRMPRPGSRAIATAPCGWRRWTARISPGSRKSPTDRRTWQRST